MLWFSPADPGSGPGSAAPDDDTAQALATGMRIASLEVELAQVKMAAQDQD